MSRGAKRYEPKDKRKLVKAYLRHKRFLDLNEMEPEEKDLAWQKRETEEATSVWRSLK